MMKVEQWPTLPSEEPSFLLWPKKALISYWYKTAPKACSERIYVLTNLFNSSLFIPSEVDLIKCLAWDCSFVKELAWGTAISRIPTPNFSSSSVVFYLWGLLMNFPRQLFSFIHGMITSISQDHGKHLFPSSPTLSSFFDEDSHNSDL